MYQVQRLYSRDPFPESTQHLLYGRYVFLDDAIFGTTSRFEYEDKINSIGYFFSQ